MDTVNIKSKLFNEIRNEIQKQVDELNKGVLKTLSKKNQKNMLPPLTLCVGAGISANINDSLNNNKYLWNELVYAIAGEIIRELCLKEYEPVLQTNSIYIETINSIVEKIVNNKCFLASDNTMECIEYLKHIAFPKQYQENDDYAENVISIIVRQLFYNNRNNCGEDKAKSIISDYYKKSYTNNSYNKGCGETIVEIAKLLQRLKNAKVLTYNYDDYLEIALDTLSNRKIQYKTIYNEKMTNVHNKNTIDIYHVHGYLPYNNENISDNRFIFSETSYNYMSDQIYHWSNRIQAETFLSNRVIFIGFSGTDVNFRQLMKEIKRERSEQSCDYTKHVMFMNYSSIINELLNSFDKDCGILLDDVKCPYAEKTLEYIAKSIMGAKASYYLEQLGIELLWYNELSEIPDIIHEIYK